MAPPPQTDHPAAPDIEAKPETPPAAETETPDPDIEKLLGAPRVDDRLPTRDWLGTPPDTGAPEEEPSPSPVRASLLPRIGAWQIATAASLMIAIAAIIVAVIPRTPTPLSIAAIGVVNAPAPLYLAETDTAGKLRLTALATISVPNGRDLQLWIIPPGEQTPTSLGVLPARGTTVTLPAPPAEGTRFVISMEPRGGAPAGRITGQVLYGGTLANR
jgi:anti-sigma-K factor RskA